MNSYMDQASLIRQNFSSIPFPYSAHRNVSQLTSCVRFTSLQWNKGFQSPSVEIPQQPMNLDYLKTEFGGHGVTFDALGDSHIANMTMNNGSKATLILEDGLITSYKPCMWHGGSLELLQTTVLEKDGRADIRGGLSLSCGLECDGESSWSPASWALQSISGDADDGIQVYLVSKDTNGMVEVRLVITLKEDLLSSELVVANLDTLPVILKGSFITHLTVSSPEATFANGLEAADFKSTSVLTSDYTIVPPGFDPFSGSSNSRSNTMVSVDGLEGEEDDNYKNLATAMSRIYTSAPSFFTILDRGRRNSISVGRDGFDEVYIFSPGSNFESYGPYSFICIGKSALLKPIVLNPGEVWRGAQYLHNPNM